MTAFLDCRRLQCVCEVSAGFRQPCVPANDCYWTARRRRDGLSTRMLLPYTYILLVANDIEPA